MTKTPDFKTAVEEAFRQGYVAGRKDKEDWSGVEAAWRESTARKWTETETETERTLDPRVWSGGKGLRWRLAGDSSGNW